MKRLFIILFGLMIALPSSMYAQTSNQELSFIYIAHDENTAVQTLINRLKEVYYDALNYPEDKAAIFYLPNGEFPVVVQVNTINDNKQDFGKLVDHLQTKRSHDVDRHTDLVTIQQIFNEVPIITEDGEPCFRFVDWNYYINSTFWNLGNNEYIIASLFWIFDMQPLIESMKLKVNLYYSSEYDVIPFNSESPFGDKALCRSMKFIPMPY
ncbi:MAG: hypothetical protein IIW52_06405 [Alistipes sp.]|nr:hypothetical protein [Alistipes sp.]